MAEKFSNHASHVEIQWYDDEQKAWHTLCNEFEEDMSCSFVSIHDAKEHLKEAVYPGLKVKFVGVVTCQRQEYIGEEWVTPEKK